MKKYSAKDIGIMAVFLSVGLMLHYVETQLSFTSIPGGRLGLSNIVSIVNIFTFGGTNAFFIAALRSVLGSFLAGNPMAALFSLSGACLSVLAMNNAKRLFFPKISETGLGILGALAHNTAQMIAASLVYKSAYVFSYLPYFCFLSLVSGTFTGYCAKLILKRFKEVLV